MVRPDPPSFRPRRANLIRTFCMSDSFCYSSLRLLTYLTTGTATKRRWPVISVKLVMLAQEVSLLSTEQKKNKLDAAERYVKLSNQMQLKLCNKIIPLDFIAL